MEELLTELAGLSTEVPPGRDPAYPFVLSAGERRSFTANTILRDPSWRKRDGAGALRIGPVDAARIGVASGDAVRVTTKRGSAVAVADVDDAMQSGHVSLPNGLGLDYPDGDARSGRHRRGAERADVQRGPRLARRHAMAQARSGPARGRRAGRIGRLVASTAMRRTRFDEWPCPIARATDLIGDWWTPLVLRELFAGRSRFDDIQAELGCSRAVLAKRLNRLVDEGMVVKVPYEVHPPRYDYRFTDKGRAFWDVLAAMWRWGSDWLWERRAAGGPGGP